MDGKWLRVCTDMTEMMFLVEAAERRHANVGRPLLAYNRRMNYLPLGGGLTEWVSAVCREVNL